MLKFALSLASLAALTAASAIPAGAQADSSAAQGGAAFPVAITVDAGKSLGDLKPIWRMFGADEPNYATMKDGRKLIAELGELRRDDVYFFTRHVARAGLVPH